MNDFIMKRLNNTSDSITIEQLDLLKNILNDILMIVVINHSGKITYVNELFCKVSKYPEGELLLSDYRLLQSEFHASSFYEKIIRKLIATERWTGEISLENKEGALFWTKTNIIPVRGTVSNKNYQYAVLLQDITAERKVQELTHFAYYDELTNLPNRRKLNRCLHSYILQASKKKSKFAVFFIDIDKFKSINDNYGHYIGDLFLKEVGKRLLNVFFEKKSVFRQSGDEFIIIFDDVEQLEKKAQEIIEVFNHPFYLDSYTINANASIGISLFPEHCKDQYRLIENADLAMFESKQYVGSSYRIYKTSARDNYHSFSNKTDK